MYECMGILYINALLLSVINILFKNVMSSFKYINVLLIKFNFLINSNKIGIRV